MHTTTGTTKMETTANITAFTSTVFAAAQHNGIRNNYTQQDNTTTTLLILGIRDDTQQNTSTSHTNTLLFLTIGSVLLLIPYFSSAVH